MASESDAQNDPMQRFTPKRLMGREADKADGQPPLRTSRSAVPEKADNLSYDLQHLLGVDITPIPSHDQLNSMTRDNAQLLVNRVFGLPTHMTDEGLVATLPTRPTYLLPRRLPIPKQKAKTRWKKFAETKGIVKRKRSRIVWDEVKQDWVPRWGYKSLKANLDKATPIVEVKHGQDPLEDPFQKRAEERQLVKAKQKLREMRNKLEGAGVRLPAGVANLASDVANRKKPKDDISTSLKRAQVSTASYGLFDKTARGETRTPPKKRRKVTPQPVSDEKASYQKTLHRLFKGGGGEIDRGKAGNIATFEEETERSRRNKVKGGKVRKGKAVGGRGGKGKGIGGKGGKGKSKR
ncbi:unnamed protein product [Vitrella brassicaformis CCMP3155]|uniref:Ribosome biogenesis regulatory protein n=2 Tax=Vitrella brassicaformis TaxID=1169539 RepID=A0A0G4FUU5_VITBC|nr:unnamed protein product [Vitrella brassicaformis CCMP3155]|eukprot:CEM18495.1 unnamed protein product [Vitrella brassicaformis CCMP3155]